ncbi:MAG: hypothetical protein M3011_12020 [Actinomycetota bacterium]|nr:hypothetical protein [Actinomycetota bacterium]
MVLMAMVAACGGKSSELTVGTKTKASSTVTTGAAEANVSTQDAGGAGAGTTGVGGSTDAGSTAAPRATEPGASTDLRRSTGGGASSGDRVTTTVAGKRKVKVAYPSGGPPDQMFPTNVDAFGLLKTKQCTELKDAAAGWADPGAGGISVRDLQGSAIDLYAGAAAACLSDWPTAKAELAQVVPADLSACDRKIALAYLQAMIEAHDVDPGTTPDTTGPGATCPD